MIAFLLLFFILLVLIGIEAKISPNNPRGTSKWVNTKNTNINIQELNELLKPIPIKKDN